MLIDSAFGEEKKKKQTKLYIKGQKKKRGGMGLEAWDSTVLSLFYFLYCIVMSEFTHIKWKVVPFCLESFESKTYKIKTHCWFNGQG